MIIAIIVFCSFIILRFITYLYRYQRIKKLYGRYANYIKDRNVEFNEYKPQIVDLFKQAGLTDNIIPRLDPAGYGKLRSLNISLFANISNVDLEFVSQIQMKFHETIGIFKHEMIKTINPIYWIEFVFKLPEYLLRYLGVAKENLALKIINIIYWISAIIFGLYKIEFLEKISTFINK